MKEWKAILKEFYSDYEQLNTLFGNKIRATADITKQDNKWTLVIYGNGLTKAQRKIYSSLVDEQFEQKLKWTDSQLSNWQLVKKLNDSTWQFSNKDDALKFKTLFNLKWTE